MRTVFLWLLLCQLSYTGHRVR